MLLQLLFCRSHFSATCLNLNNFHGFLALLKDVDKNVQQLSSEHFISFCYSWLSPFSYSKIISRNWIAICKILFFFRQ